MGSFPRSLVGLLVIGFTGCGQNAQSPHAEAAESHSSARPGVADASTAAPVRGPKRRVAVTFDDLPLARANAHSLERAQAVTAGLLSQLTRANIPAIGFVNERTLEIGKDPRKPSSSRCATGTPAPWRWSPGIRADSPRSRPHYWKSTVSRGSSPIPPAYRPRENQAAGRARSITASTDHRASTTRPTTRHTSARWQCGSGGSRRWPTRSGASSTTPLWVRRPAMR